MSLSASIAVANHRLAAELSNALLDAPACLNMLSHCWVWVGELLLCWPLAAIRETTDQAMRETEMQLSILTDLLVGLDIFAETPPRSNPGVGEA